MSLWKLALTLPIALFLVGCSSKNETPTGTVKGKVTLDEKPLAVGKITFDANDGTTPVVLDIKDGSYEGKVATGPKAVRVTATKLVDPPKNGMTGPAYEKQIEQNYIPDRYNVKSTLKAEVTAGGPNAFSFDVTSK